MSRIVALLRLITWSMSMIDYLFISCDEENTFYKLRTIAACVMPFG